MHKTIYRYGKRHSYVCSYFYAVMSACAILILVVRDRQIYCRHKSDDISNINQTIF